ncbi:hypothetical protein LX36DRAFT_658950 [Colletotrichum falcatum]|nr:hypothetical protein LX36DRAFT_658950 [Colletotrichum falcatum]
MGKSTSRQQSSRFLLSLVGGVLNLILRSPLLRGAVDVSGLWTGGIQFSPRMGKQQ